MSFSDDWLKNGLPVFSGGGLVQTHYATFAHVQADKGKTSVQVAAPFGATFYIKQTEGTGRSFDWCITSG